MGAKETDLSTPVDPLVSRKHTLTDRIWLLLWSRWLGTDDVFVMAKSWKVALIDRNGHQRQCIEFMFWMTVKEKWNRWRRRVSD